MDRPSRKLKAPGKKIMKDGDLLPELKRRIALIRAAFVKVDNIMRSQKASMAIKNKDLR